MDKIGGSILNTIVNHLEENGFPVDLETDMLFILYGNATLSIDANVIGLSFSISLASTEAAIITKLIMEVCSNYKTHNVEIYEPFFEIFDEDYNYIDTLWGEDIDDHMDDIEYITTNN